MTTRRTLLAAALVAVASLGLSAVAPSPAQARPCNDNADIFEPPCHR
jgi:hypothetical protein